MKLWKLHGAGNDFLIMDNRENLIEDKAEFTASICHRHFGIGADGFMALETSPQCDIKMSYYNADGTKDSMCGNGIRCLAKFARDNGIVDKRKFTIETDDGIKEIQMIAETETESQVKINMGGYTFDTKALRIDTDLQEFIRQPLTMKDGRIFEVSSVHLGVNHSAIFVQDDLDYVGLYGSELENHPVFLADMNFNFLRYIDPSHVEVSTWERGVGRTLACGTGSSAAVVIASRLLPMAETVNVKAPGGNLRITLVKKESPAGSKGIESMEDEGTVLVYMEGPAVKIGEIIL